MAPIAPELQDQVARSIAQWNHMDPDLDVEALNVFGRVHRVFLLYQAQIARAFEAHDINASSFASLAALYRSGPPHRLTVSALAEETLISSGGMTLRLDRLEQSGFIVRERDRGDRRVVFAQLTEQGITVVRAAARDHFWNETRQLRDLKPVEQERLAKLLSKLEQTMLELSADPRSVQEIKDEENAATAALKTSGIS